MIHLNDTCIVLSNVATLQTYHNYYSPVSPLHLLRSGIFPVVPELVASGRGSGSRGPFSKTKHKNYNRTNNVYLD